MTRLQRLNWRTENRPFFRIPHSQFGIPAMTAVQIVTTTPSLELAEQIAGRLVEARLAACVQIDGPIGSVYRWQGKIERDQEWRLTIKTAEARFAAVEDAICELHPYDVPEILCMPVSRGSEAYLRWLDEQVSQ